MKISNFLGHFFILLILFHFSTQKFTSQTDNRFDIYNQLMGPIPISNQIKNFTSKFKNVHDASQLSIGGWIQIKSTNDTNDYYQIFEAIHNPKITTKLSDLIPDNKLHPCPLAIQNLLKSPELLNNFTFSENPNCFANQIQKLIFETKTLKIPKKIMTQMKIKASNFYFLIQFPTFFNQTSWNLVNERHEFFVDDILLNSWVFFGISLDFFNGIGNFVLFSQANSVLAERKISFQSSNLTFSSSFQISVSNNSNLKKGNVALLSQLNFYYLYFPKTFWLSLFAAPPLFLDDQIFYTDLIFSSKKNDTVKNFGENSTSIFLSDKILQKANGFLFLPDAILPINKILPQKLPNTLINSPMIYFLIQFYSEKTTPLIIFIATSIETDTKNSNKIEVSLYPNSSKNITGFQVGVILSSKNSSISILSSNFFPFKDSVEFYISFITFPDNTTQIFLHSDSSSTLSANFTNYKIEFEKMEISLQNSNISPTINNSSDINSLIKYLIEPQNSPKTSEFLLFQRFSIMKTSLPLISTITSTKASSPCKVTIIPRIGPDSCFICQNSVLFRPDSMCIEFCPPQTHVLAGMCVDCKTPSCLEVHHPLFNVTITTTGDFMVNLTRNITSINSSNIGDLFSASLKNKQGSVFISNNVTPISDTSFLLKFNVTKSIANPKLQIVSKSANDSYFYDSNRNFIYELNEEKTMAQIKSSLDEKLHIVSVFAYFFIALFYFMFFEGIILFAISLSYNLHSIALKHILNSFTYVQILILLIYLNVPLPAVFQSFLFVIYDYTYGLSLGLISEPIQTQYSFVNLPTNTVSPLFVDNFETILIILTIILISYGAFMIFGFLSHFLCPSFKKTVLNFKKGFEFNLMVICILAFDYAGIVFATLNLKLDFQAVVSEIKEEKETGTWMISKIISITFLAFLGFLILSILVLYVIFEGFVQKSHAKLNLSIFFIGSKNKRLANACEFIMTFLRILFGFVLAFFFDYENFQIIALLVIQVCCFLVLIIIRPYQNAIDNWVEIITNLLLVFLISSFTHLKFINSEQTFLTETREIIGWVYIGSYVLFFLGSVIYDLCRLIFFFMEVQHSKQMLKEIKNKSISLKVFENQIVMNDSKLNTENEMKDDDFMQIDADFGKLKDVRKLGESEIKSLGNSLANSEVLTANNEFNSAQSSRYGHGYAKEEEFSDSSFEEDEHDFKIQIK